CVYLTASDAAEAEIFDLDELLDPVLRAFSSQARFLHAAEGRHLGRDDSRVDTDDAGLERFGNAPDATDVSPVEIGSQAELRIVGESNRFLVCFEPEEGSDRTKRLFTGHHHSGRHVGEDGGLEEAAAQVVAIAADEHARALGD